MSSRTCRSHRPRRILEVQVIGILAVVEDKDTVVLIHECWGARTELQNTCKEGRESIVVETDLRTRAPMGVSRRCST
jgi:hypothetical protein